ncbi:PLD nuclease N-terminal domain-containing protein [Thermogemmatispora onikobensis]|uniref:PLD nuclease N-terminal domain-containing protein n=1 Tax=Thermogemmatispora onikobensis TaxID=732234 RepID=UPI0008528DBA|nr:PLD nuclease N-terminal domain-containing protein [Thermogemmatispora onikobensis]
MSGERGCLFNSLLFLIIVFVPIVGHIIETFMILEDDHSAAGKLLWLAVIWLIPFLGPLLYLLFGQRRHHVALGQPSYGTR